MTNSIGTTSTLSSLLCMEAEPVPSLPAPPPAQLKPKPNQGCAKHSRCHCNLMSFDTPDFFVLKA